MKRRHNFRRHATCREFFHSFIHCCQSDDAADDDALHRNYNICRRMQILRCAAPRNAYKVPRYRYQAVFRSLSVGNNGIRVDRMTSSAQLLCRGYITCAVSCLNHLLCGLTFRRPSYASHPSVMCNSITNYKYTNSSNLKLRQITNYILDSGLGLLIGMGSLCIYYFQFRKINGRHIGILPVFSLVICIALVDAL